MSISEQAVISKVYEHLAYLASSAQGLFQEPKEYGPLRCVDAMKRFIELVIELGLVKDEKILNDLNELREKLRTGVVLLMYSTEEFRKFVTNLNVELSEKILKII